jgi:NADPH2:quinone reductase
MKALVCQSLDDGNLSWQSVAEPEADAGRLLLEVKAASVNFPDALLVQGKYQIRLQPPFIPGMEVAGVVSAVGAAVTDIMVGDRVSAVLPEFGGFAERVSVKPEFTFKIPDSLPFDIAACVPSVYATSYYALCHRARLQRNETVLVLGAAGGVGMATIALAKKMGANVIAAVSSDAKAEAVRNYGADHVVDYIRSDLKSAVAELTEGRGVDIVVDPVGGDISLQALRTLAWDGRHLVIGFAAGDIPRIATNRLLLKSISMIGVNFGGFTTRYDQQAKQICQQMNDWLAQDHALWPMISESTPMQDGGGVVASFLSRKSIGKRILLLES